MVNWASACLDPSQPGQICSALSTALPHLTSQEQLQSNKQCVACDLPHTHTHTCVSMSTTTRPEQLMFEDGIFSPRGRRKRRVCWGTFSSSTSGSAMGNERSTLCVICEARLHHSCMLITDLEILYRPIKPLSDPHATALVDSAADV